MPRFIKTFVSDRISSDNLRSGIRSLDDSLNKFIEENKVKLVGMKQTFSPPIYGMYEGVRENHIIRVVFYEADKPVEEKY